MAGSMARYQYIAEDGESYALKCDRSNANAVNGTLVLAPNTMTSLPNNIKPRHVTYRSTNGKVSRKCYLMAPVTDINTIPAEYAIAVAQAGAGTVDVTLRKTFYSGEQYSFVPNATDTGLDDTDAATTI